MRRGFALLLCLLLSLSFLAGCGTAAEKIPEEIPADEETEAEAPDFAGCIEEQTFAMTLACWASAFDDDADPQDPLLLWDAAGWYAARLYRAEGYDLLDSEQTESFLRSLGCSGELQMPEGWEEYGTVRKLRSSDGSTSYDFVQHKQQFDEMLGINTEIAVNVLGEDTAEGVLTYHFENGEQISWSYVLRFERDGGAESHFPYRLTELSRRQDGMEIDPALGFTLEEVIAANRLQNIFSRYPAVRICHTTYSPEISTWVFKHGEYLAILTAQDGYASGQFRGCYFTWQEMENGKMRACIDEISDEAGNWEAQDGYLADVFQDICIMRLDRVRGDLIWMDCTYRGGYSQKIAVDKETLALREISYTYSESQPASVTRYEYVEPFPPFNFLYSWDLQLRTVTLYWENYENGQRHTWTEQAVIPMDWEYVPWQGRWGDYTIYLNEGYTWSYTYPGDSIEYALYLTTAKG